MMTVTTETVTADVLLNTPDNGERYKFVNGELT